MYQYAETVATAVNTQSGEILAVVDGKNPGKGTARRNFANEPHQPGSSAKPFFAYGPAIENDKWSTAKQLTDKPTEVNGKEIGNYYDGYRGTNTIRHWLKISANTPAIQTYQEIGGDSVEAFAEKSGLKMKDDESISPAYAIGGMKHGFNTTQMAGAYATLGNGGDYIKPHVIKSIEYSDGSKIKSPIKSKKAMEDYTAYMLTDMLRDVLKPGGTFPSAGLSFDAVVRLERRMPIKMFGLQDIRLMSQSVFGQERRNLETTTDLDSVVRITVRWHSKSGKISLQKRAIVHPHHSNNQVLSLVSEMNCT
ncbi:penicillin-binding transpeptidase domain-containing protein [Exiguobacterium sp. SL14]|nr:penicillin-binding transpeptidase domain-containing protein [Exiguobacterium sp. SL14]MCY1690770.1 penicillin-binding transpeptidase domain-containing protein [Exiguobacterium sp. SL14]